MASKHPLFLCHLLMLCLVAICHAADPKFYSIWPMYTLDAQSAFNTTNQAITDALNADLKNDPSKLYISRSDSLESTWYWYAQLTDDLVTKYEGFPGVRKVALPNNARESFRATPVRRETSSFTTDTAAPDQLRVLSLPEGSALAKSKGYVYDSSAGEGINIYVIDSGLTPDSPEFKSRTVSWLFAGPFAAHDMTDADVGGPDAKPNAQGHGTCMASVAMGNKDGVARKASLTVVRSDTFSNNNADSSAEIWIDGLAKVYEDVINKKAQGKAVVSMSIGLTANLDENYTACIASTMQALLLALDVQDIPVVAAVQNDGTEINVYPALLAKAVNGTVPVPNLVIVSGALTNGNYYNDVRDKEIKIYGPADDESGGTIATPGLECASLDGKGYHRGEQGTSHATASVAGVIAYFMGQGNTGAASRKNLFDIAVTRVKNGPPMPWNDVDGTSS